MTDRHLIESIDDVANSVSPISRDIAKATTQLTRIANALEHIAGTDKEKSEIDNMTQQDVLDWFNNPKSGLATEEYYAENKDK